MLAFNKHNPCKTLIAEDEPLARQKLMRLLHAFEWLQIIGQSTDGPQTRDAIDALKPDLVFLDINMPVMSGVDALRAARHRPHVIFTTAYDQHAVTAFELGAIDYLLKPFGSNRLGNALQRLQKQPHPLSTASMERFEKALSPKGDADFFLVRAGASVEKVRFSDIELIEGDAEYIRLYSGQREHLLRLRLYDIEERLLNSDFVRIHRSRIINLTQVDHLKNIRNGRYEVKLNNGKCVQSSRAGGRKLRELIL